MPMSYYFAQHRRMDDDELEAMLLGLAVACQHDACQRTCPLKRLRTGTLYERFQALTVLGRDAKLCLMARLLDCLPGQEATPEVRQNT